MIDVLRNFLARTPPGSYPFSSAPRTTDTDRSQIRRPEGHSLGLQ